METITKELIQNVIEGINSHTWADCPCEGARQGDVSSYLEDVKYDLTKLKKLREGTKAVIEHSIKNFDSDQGEDDELEALKTFDKYLGGDTTLPVTFTTTKGELKKMLSGKVSPKLKKQIKMAMLTDEEKLATVYKKLEKEGILNIGKLNLDLEDSRETHKGLIKILKKYVKELKGVVSQRSDRITFSSVKDNNPEHQKIGKRIETLLKEYGFRPNWCGGADQKIEI